MEHEQINTIGANNYARNIDNSPVDVDLNWWEFFSNYRAKKWRRELKALVKETGITFSDICDYIGIESSEMPGFYKKLPKTKETYIGIGMAYKRDLDTINRWLLKYGGKRKLYIKDAINDLVWIYLINANNSNGDSARNYFSEYDSCKEALAMVYGELGNEEIEKTLETVKLDEKIKNISYDIDHVFLKMFVKENISAFKTAYAKPRRFLKQYLTNILRTKNLDSSKAKHWTLNSLRGYLDDSMINYLSGADDTVEMVETDNQMKTFETKYVPINKRTHIALCLAIGMSVDEINTYLEMMGYSPLDGTNPDEGQLMNLLEKWEREHPLQRKYKKKYLEEDSDIVLTQNEEIAAVEEMLQLRRDLKDAYEKEWSSVENGEGIENKKKKFPYLKE